MPPKLLMLSTKTYKKSVFSILLSSIYINISSDVIQKKEKKSSQNLTIFYKQGGNLQIQFHPSRSVTTAEHFIYNSLLPYFQ